MEDSISKSIRIPKISEDTLKRNS